jgi:hypothetical protein
MISFKMSWYNYAKSGTKNRGPLHLPDWAKKYLGTLASTNKISAEQLKV